MFERSVLEVYFVAGTQDCLPRADTPENNLLQTLEEALRAGISCYQFREKGTGSLQDGVRIEALAYACRDLCRQFHVPFVMNNEVALAVKMGADGVHIGQGDMPVMAAAKLCDKKLFLGLSHENLTQVRVSVMQKVVDYLAIGPVFHTPSKSDAAPIVGVDFVRQARACVGEMPLVAIGGIGVAQAADVRSAGADGVAVISAIAKAEHMAATVQALRG